MNDDNSKNGSWRSLVALAFAAALAAQTMPALADDPDFLAFGAGYYDFGNDENAGEFRIEYRSDHKLWIFKPFVGLMSSTDGAVNGYAGIAVDVYIGHHLVLTPSFAPGFYSNGDGKNLGSELEFRSALEIAYRFRDRSRLGVVVYHLSNAYIVDKNPGTEVVSLTYAIPLGRGN